MPVTVFFAVLGGCTSQRDPLSLPERSLTWWAGKDSNLRRLSRQIYSLLPLAAWVPTPRALELSPDGVALYGRAQRSAHVVGTHP
jgi:hypothetical protein